MSEANWTRDEVESPCVKICVLHPDIGVCIGCWRSGEEIAQWSEMTPGARRAVLDALPERAKLLKTRRGGRKGHLKRGLSAPRPSGPPPEDI